jgi:hypothetical protein
MQKIILFIHRRLYFELNNEIIESSLGSLCEQEVNWVCNKSNTTGATCGAGTAYPSGAPEFTHCFSRVRVAQSLVSV